MINIPYYQITKQIYQSANSLVYRGLRNLDNQPVIFKVLKEDYPSPLELTRYRQEYDITRRLADLHGVINVYRLEKHQNTLVMCLEDFGGESLKIWLDKQRTFTLDELFTLAIRATDILGQIHQQNIIHKDINPSNIVFNPTTGVLKIIDFGIATQLSKQHLTLKNPNVLEGTLAYMSPEQTGRMNRALDYRTDFYSLGATFYELFTGVVPFNMTDAMALVHCHIAKQPVPPVQVNPDIPPIISDIILKLLEKTAENRYQSAWGIKADLEKCQENQNLRGLNFELAQKDISVRFQIPQKLYGREHEIETLLAAFERVATGSETKNQVSSKNLVSKSEIMLVAGYSGIGKSVLVKEIYKSLGEKQGYFISGKFDQFQRNIPYSAIVKAFGELAQQLLTESDTQLTQWKNQLLTALGPNGQVIIDVIPKLELVIGKQSAVPILGPRESQNRFKLVFQNFMRVFCQPAHPLVIFLDDLQWVDLATLKLLFVIMTDRDTSALFLIGAYRDNKVSPTHPLMMTLDTLGKEDVTINQITLKPLAFEHINQLIADSLHQKAVGSLTDLVMRKTEGNPFFVNQFLHTLYEEELLTFQTSEVSKRSAVLQFGWQWDIDQIEAMNITDNVVDLMIGKLKKLPQSAQHVLRLAACVGNHFDLDTLSVIYEKSATDTFQDLMPVMTEGLILPTSELEMSGDDIHDSQIAIRNFLFLHDRVQQAAYALIDDEQKKAVHLKIGQLLLANTSARTEKLFEIVDHLNLSQELIIDSPKKIELAQLNLEAGKKAKDTAAYATALRYLMVGINCLTETNWETHYQLTFELHKERGEVEYLNGDLGQSENTIKLTVARAKSPLEKADIYNTLIIQYTGAFREDEAIETGRQALALLGIELPETDLQVQAKFNFAKVTEKLANIEVASLINLPEAVNPEKKLAIKLLSNLISPTYLSRKDWFSVTISMLVSLSLKYGLVAESSFGFSAYGMFLGTHFADYKKGYEFGRLAVNIGRRFNRSDYICRACFALGNSLLHWVRPLKETESIFNEGFQAGLVSGEFQFGGLILMNKFLNSFYQGRNIESVLKDVPKLMSYVEKNNHRMAAATIFALQVAVSDLIEPVDTASMSEAKFVEKCHNNNHTLCQYYILKAKTLYLCSRHAEALQYALEAEKIIDAISGHFQVREHNFYHSLSLVALYPQVSTEQQAAYWEKLEANKKQMKIWADNCPENVRARYQLLKAEMARASGKELEVTMALYDSAIASANKNEFIQIEALGNELAAKFWLSLGKDKFAQTYLIEAHYHYQQWGAVAKVKDLEDRYPQFVALKTLRPVQTGSTILATKPTSTASQGTTSNGLDLDLNSVVKAYHALSGEIVLSRLLEQMMHIVIENAGAEKGLLLLPKQDNWFIEAEGYVDNQNVSVLQSIAVDKFSQVSANIIHYVARTQENVVLHDATIDGTYQRDPYIVEHRPKSVLCAPLLNQGHTTGLLYLENNLTTGAFTPERLEVLNLLSSQIAISIENAWLYNNLEQKVAERTQELSDAIEHLKATQAQLVESEKMASLGGLVAGVAHEINTPIGIGLMAASTLTNETDITATAYKNKQLKGSALKNYFESVEHGGQLILNNLRRASELVKSFKQIAVDQSNLEKRSFVVKKYIEETLVTLNPQLKQTQHQVTVNGDDQIEIDGYPGAFSQVITNLVMNSLTHAYQEKEEGHLCFDIHSESERLMLEYRDDGCGIPAEHLGKIFEPFFTTGRAKGATGLGLHITYNLVTQKLTGTISVESFVGVGTTFTINLPLKIYLTN